MVQHKIKTKQTLPKGCKAKVKKGKQPVGGPRKGHALHIAPKKKTAIQEATTSAAVSKIINDKNEEMVRGRADVAVGKSTTGKKK
ncbi:hypothetical protein PFISCL1PPCAC_25094 [Pristionchus fissidentatus]|uniref:Uncharacterized protein n=1 Tax=Pristionchus fissidentatus TaxID=1538716 RepID=A0AAV5WRV0_9BILA|nr:hypothetical protein PFISCL1PPCAC_25094 [Pristionchus fissidentatus]